MSFFVDKSQFTHYGRMCGIPVYIKEPYSEGPTVAGTNIIYDFLIEHVIPLGNSVASFLSGEDVPFAIEIRGEIKNES